MWGRRVGWIVMMAASLSACSDSDAFAPDPNLADFVGMWDATALVLSSPVTPSLSADLIALGSTFSLNIQPSEQYTAILIFMGQASTEIGRISRSGETVIFDRTFPVASREISTYVFAASDRLVLDGDTEFDFNQDGIADQALAHFELKRR